jgi:uncharacterized protein YndB with AHSA1/START domain
MTMTQAADTAVRQEIVVNAPIERAFNVFTEGYQTWNPPEHHIGEADIEDSVMEPREGGRWYEIGVDGSTCEWGRVLTWEPPTRVVLAWMIGADWKHDADPSHASEVDVRFTALGDSQTRVELEHRHLDRHGEGWEAAVRAPVSSPGGWPGTLQLYKAKAEEQAA